MFKFLKLRNSDFGDARRHVPFGSIIHKPLFLIFALLFSFVCIIPVKVLAAAPQIKPQFKPILDTDIVNFQDSYLQLDPAAQAAASLLFGAYVTEYAGLADYGYVFDSVPTEASFKERLIFMGDQLVDTLFLPVNMADQLVLTPLINLGQGIVNKVKGVTNVDDFYDDILDATDYGLSYTPDIGFALNQLFAVNGGLYNWQISEQPFTFDFTWRQSNLGTLVESYNNALANLGSVRFFANTYSDAVSNLVISPVDITQFDVFINTSQSWISYHGLENLTQIYFDYVCIVNGSVSSGRAVCSDLKKNFNGSVYNTPAAVINQVFNNPSNYRLLNFYINGIYLCYPAYQMVNSNYYAGTSWDNRYQVTNQSDLGFSDTDSLQLLNPIADAVFDLKALVQQIVENQTDPNYELPLQPIIYNVTQVNGSPLTAEDLEGISFNVTPPESGIDIPLNVFAPLFDNGKGFISYMWYMTKPLVMYTRSFLEAITFDPVNGFNASGPGYFILGVAGLGLIGGVIVKFLL